MFCFQGPPPPPAGKALLNFDGTEPGELRCGEGDTVVLQRRGDELWYHGLLPAGFVQSVRPLPPAPPQGKALYDFEMKDRDQDKDCLSFSKVRWVLMQPSPDHSPSREPG